MCTSMHRGRRCDPQVGIRGRCHDTTPTSNGGSAGFWGISAASGGGTGAAEHRSASQLPAAAMGGSRNPERETQARALNRVALAVTCGRAPSKAKTLRAIGPRRWKACDRPVSPW